MAGKASLPKTPIDDTVDLNKARKKQFGRERAAYAKVQTGSGSTGVSFAGTGNTIAPISSNVLTTEGGIPMSGPLAFTPKLVSVDSNGEIDIGKSTSNFSSYIIVTGASNSADDLKQIHGANNAGQILYLEAATTTPITLKQHTGSSGGGNINIPGGSDFTVSGESIVLLQWDTTYEAYSGSYGQWTLVSSSSSSSSLLSSANNWTGVNTFAANVSMNGATTTIGDNANDILAIYSKMGTDLNMSTYDIINLCRLEFDPAGSTLANTAVGIDATADEMHFNVPVGDDFKFTVNGTEEFIFKSNEVDVKDNDICNVGTIFTDYISTSSGNTMIKSIGHFDPFGGDTYDLGDATNYWRHLYISGDIHFKDGDDAEIKKVSTGLEYEIATGDYHRFQVNNVTKLQVSATSCSLDGGMTIGSADSVEIGYKVDNQALTVGSKGSMIHPYLESTTNHSTGSNSTLDGYFGNQNGAIGIQYDSSESAGSGKYRIWVRADGGWYKTEVY